MTPHSDRPDLEQQRSRLHAGLAGPRPAVAAVAKVNGPTVAESAGAPGMAPPGSARVAAGGYRSRYAGAMLLRPYLGMAGAAL